MILRIALAVGVLGPAVVQGLKSNCEACKQLQKAIEKNMEKTRNQNFGGGNTKWEESRLGPWATSETRLIQTVDYACKGDFKCSSFQENYEDEIEEWFKSGPDSAPEDQRKTFFDEICVNIARVCCSSERAFGKHCEPCPIGANEKVCGGHGKCNGAGDRAGKGGCNCDAGYKGKVCDECTSTYYKVIPENPEELEDEMYTPECRRCNIGCKDECFGPGAGDCKNGCKDGYELKEKKIWKRVSEDSSEGKEFTELRCEKIPKIDIDAFKKSVENGAEDEDEELDEEGLDSPAEVSDDLPEGVEIKVGSPEAKSPEAESPPPKKEPDARFAKPSKAFSQNHDEF